jgi:hypothetical protein
MAKAVALTADDLNPSNSSSRKTAGMRQRGVTPTSELVPLQFRLPPEFIHTFKQAALDRNMKLNELFISCFDEFMKNSNKP